MERLPNSRNGESQGAVEEKIDKQLKEGHIQKVEKINDNLFIQPVVIKFKRRTPDPRMM